MSAFVTIDAKPEPMSFDPARAAVIVVDMQNDFGAEGGMFARAGTDIAPIRKAIEPTKAVLTAARRAGVKLVYLKMEFHPDLSNAGSPESPNRIKHQPLPPQGTNGLSEPTAMRTRAWKRAGLPLPKGVRASKWES